MAALAGMASAGWGGAPWPVMAGAAALGASVVPWLPAQLVSLAPALVAGLGAAGAARLLRWRPHAGFSVLASLAAGVAAGLAADLHWATPAEALGGTAAILALGSLGLLALRLLDRKPGCRTLLGWGLAVAGAWILALAILMLLLRL